MRAHDRSLHALSRLRKQGRLTAGLRARRARAGRSVSSRPHSALAPCPPLQVQSFSIDNDGGATQALAAECAASV